MGKPLDSPSLVACPPYPFDKEIYQNIKKACP
jgi:hypothetical protein